MKTDILIIGGGLSGLALAWQLETRGRDYRIIEARDRFGGRIKSHTVNFNGEKVQFDLGPAWFWPGQPRMAAMIAEFGLGAFHQFAEGELSYEDAAGPVQRGRGFSSMEGSYRLTGSFSALVEALEEHLPRGRTRLSHKARKITLGTSVMTFVETPSEEELVIESNRVVLAVPPRVAAHSIRFMPDLSKATLSAMHNIPTWMAGHAKVLAVYDRPFWREDGLSGDAMSRRGPMVEIHDASPAMGGPYALFGFLGVPALARKGQGDAVMAAALEQLIRLFGDKAADPISLVLQDWAFDEQTATQRDHEAVSHHPSYGLPQVLSEMWDGRLIMGSTEVASQFGGYLEGALEASEQALALILQG